MTSESKPGDCSQIVDVLVDYLEGHLSPRTRHELDDHLRKCPHCIAQLRTYRTTITLLRGLCDDDLPAELRSSVASFLDEQTTH